MAPLLSSNCTDSEKPIKILARVLSEGFVYQGEPSPIHDGKPRGEPSAHLPTIAFVMFLQNDRAGNRATGERLRSLAREGTLYAATGLPLLSPQIPMLFMEEEHGSTQPFLFFTDYHDELADAACEGRRKEFATLSGFTDEKRRAEFPDPNHESTFENSSPGKVPAAADHENWRYFYRSALAVRSELLMPRLKGVKPLGARVIGEKSLMAS